MPHTDRSESEAALTAPGAPFAVVRTESGSLVYAGGPRTLREFVETTWSYGEQPFLVAGSLTRTYGEFFAAASALACRLVGSYGLRPGDRVVIDLGNHPDGQTGFWAAQLAGLVAVPLNSSWSDDEFMYVLDDCGPRVLLVDGARLPRAAAWARRESARVVAFHSRGSERGTDGPVEWYEDFPAPDPFAAPPEVDVRPEDDATIFYAPGEPETYRPSGTRGSPAAPAAPARPRGAVATHLAHTGAAMNARFGAALAAVGQGRFPGQGPVPVTTVTYPLSGAAALTPLYSAMAVGGTLVLESADDPAPVASGYGRTETTGEVLTGPPTLRPTPATEVRIAGPDGTPLPEADADEGVTGELWLRGQSLARGYWHGDAAGTAAFPPASAGWFRTGDRATVHAGTVTVRRS